VSGPSASSRRRLPGWLRIAFSLSACHEGTRTVLGTFVDSKSPPILFRGGPCRWLLPVEWLALFLGAFLLLRCPLGMDDFFYLTRSGEYLLQTGHVLAVNLFSFTAPDHPWINHAWLSGLVFHLVHSGLGLPGVVALNAGCYLAAGLLFARNLRRCGAGPVARLVLILIYAGAVAKPYAVVRPWIFSHILFQCLLGLWLASREEADPRTVRKRLAMGVFIVWLWLNLHGSFYVGLLTFFLQLFTLRFQTKKQDSTNKNVHSTSVPELLLWAVFAVGLLSLNPYGTSYLVVPFQFLRGAVNLKAGGAYLAHLEEWASVLSFALFMDYLSAALGLVILAFIAVKTFRRQIRFSDWPRLVFFAASAMLILVAHRNDYFFLTANLCLFYPVMFSRRPQTDGDSVAAVSDRRNPPPRNEQPAVRDRRYSTRHDPGTFPSRVRFYLDLVPSAQVAACWFLIPCVSFLILSASKPPSAFLDPAFWPPQLMAHLERDPFYRTHHGFWDFDFSNIPIYRSDLHLKTFFDLREYCYPDEVVRDFFSFYGSKDDAVVRTIRKWDLRYLVVRKGTGLDVAVSRFFRTPSPYVLSVRFEDAASRIYEIAGRPPNAGRL